MPQKMSDERVVARYREGDASAVGELFERYLPLLRARVRRRLPARVRRKVAESDVIQEALLGAIRRIGDFEDRGEGSFGAWLTTIVDRRLTDQMRRFVDAGKRNVNREISVGDTPAAGQRAADTPSVSGDLQRKEALDAVMASVDSLAPADQRILRLVHFRGQTLANAAELLGVTPDAARMRYGRALVRLQSALKRGGREEGP